MIAEEQQFPKEVFLRLIVSFSLLWAVAGSFAFEYVLGYLGLDKLGFELKWTLFVGLTFAVAAVTALFFVGLTWVFRGISRFRQA